MHVATVDQIHDRIIDGIIAPRDCTALYIQSSPETCDCYRFGDIVNTLLAWRYHQRCTASVYSWGNIIYECNEEVDHVPSPILMDHLPISRQSDLECVMQHLIDHPELCQGTVIIVTGGSDIRYYFSEFIAMMSKFKEEQSLRIQRLVFIVDSMSMLQIPATSQPFGDIAGELYKVADSVLCWVLGQVTCCDLRNAASHPQPCNS